MVHITKGSSDAPYLIEQGLMVILIFRWYEPKELISDMASVCGSV